MRGWDWAAGAVTWQHGSITLPVTAYYLGALRGFGAWLVASLAIAAGTGWRLVIDRRGFLFSWTWFGLPLTWRRLEVGSPFGVDDDPWSATELAEWVRLGVDGSSTCAFGSAMNAAGVVHAIQRAVARHHAAPERACTYRQSARA